MMLVSLSQTGNDSAPWLAFGQAIREWEPTLDLWLELGVPRIYEPDGTFYAISLGTTRLSTDRRVVDINRGDLIVVPRGLAIDVDTPVDLLCLKHDGIAPYHFRERFIQIWGFERISAQDAIDPDRTAEHRLKYQVIDLEPGTPHSEPGGLNYRIVVILTGECQAESHSAPDQMANLTQASILSVTPGVDFIVMGSGRIGVLQIPNEMMHEFRISERHRGKPPTPDFPGPPI